MESAPIYNSLTSNLYFSVGMWVGDKIQVDGWTETYVYYLLFYFLDHEFANLGLVIKETLKKYKKD